MENSDINASNTAKNPFNVVPHNCGNAIIEDGMVKAKLSKLSWNVIRLSRK